MKSRPVIKKLAALAVTAGALVGCGVGGNTPAPQPLAAPPTAEWSHPAFEVLVENSDHKKAHEEFMAKLALTSEQKTQIKGVMLNALERMKPIREKMKPLVTGEKVDQAALDSAIAEYVKEDAKQDAQTMSELRAVLTEAQRKLVADKLIAMSTSKQDPHKQMFEKLMKEAAGKIKLTTEQKQSFMKMKSDFMSFWDANREAYLTKIASFMWHGKQEMLQQDFENLSSKWPKESAVSFIAGLDQSQRQAMVDWKEQWLAKFESKLKK